MRIPSSECMNEVNLKSGVHFFICSHSFKSSGYPVLMKNGYMIPTNPELVTRFWDQIWVPYSLEPDKPFQIQNEYPIPRPKRVPGSSKFDSRQHYSICTLCNDRVALWFCPAACHAVGRPQSLSFTCQYVYNCACCWLCTYVQIIYYCIISLCLSYVWDFCSAVYINYLMLFHWLWMYCQAIRGCRHPNVAKKNSEFAATLSSNVKKVSALSCCNDATSS